jgi:SAM-dependent methyltransferase
MAATLPVDYSFWRRFTLCRHGSMDEVEYALATTRKHLAVLTPSQLRGASVLELGPGDSVASGLVGHAHGVEHTVLIDTGFFARRDAAIYRQVADRLAKEGVRVAGFDTWRSVSDALDATNTRYLTTGTEALADLPSNSFDLVWSQAVLEHVHRDEIGRLLGEIRRLLKPSGLSSHVVDLEDHLAHSLHSLRFPSRFWESPTVRRSGLYTNRLRLSEWLTLFESASLVAAIRERAVWPSPPIRRSALRSSFRELDEDELCVRGFWAVLTPATETTDATTDPRRPQTHLVA